MILRSFCPKARGEMVAPRWMHLEEIDGVGALETRQAGATKDGAAQPEKLFSGLSQDARIRNG